MEPPMTPEASPRAPSRGRHREVLGVAIAVMILAFLLEVRDDQRVSLRGWTAYPVPELCTSRSWFGMPCPGCGLTRGIIHIAHARWIAAFEVNRLSGVMAFIILIQIPYRIYCLRTGQLPFGDQVPRVIGGFLIGALFLNWIIGLTIEKTARPKAPPTSQSQRQPGPD
jgi:Protein of unknown function (DUF2752)